MPLGPHVITHTLSPHLSLSFFPSSSLLTRHRQSFFFQATLPPSLLLASTTTSAPRCPTGPLPSLVPSPLLLHLLLWPTMLPPLSTSSLQPLPRPFHACSHRLVVVDFFSLPLPPPFSSSSVRRNGRWAPEALNDAAAMRRMKEGFS